MSLRDDARPPSFFEAAALATLERGVNTALRSDPATARDLAEHSGRLVSLHFTMPPMRIFILIVEDGVELYHGSDAQPDVALQGSVVDLLAQLFEWRGAPSVIGGPVSIQGDRELLQALIALAKRLDIDWGAMMEPVIGSEIAQQIDLGARRLFDWARNAATRLGGQLSEFLKEESTLLALRRDVHEFYEDVDELRSDTDRLAARIDRLKQKAGNLS